MSLESVAKTKEKIQQEKDVAVETLKDLVDRRQYKEAGNFLNGLSEELHDHVRRERSCALYLKELSFASI